MSAYLLLTTLTDAGRKNLQEDPEILKDFNKEAEYLGVKVICQYALLGQFDFVNIVEAPGNEVVAKLAIRLSARGHIQTLSLPAIDIENLIAALKEKQTPW